MMKLGEVGLLLRSQHAQTGDQLALSQCQVPASMSAAKEISRDPMQTGGPYIMIHVCQAPLHCADLTFSIVFRVKSYNVDIRRY